MSWSPLSLSVRFMGKKGVCLQNFTCPKESITVDIEHF